MNGSPWTVVMGGRGGKVENYLDRDGTFWYPKT